MNRLVARTSEQATPARIRRAPLQCPPRRDFRRAGPQRRSLIPPRRPILAATR